MKRGYYDFLKEMESFDFKDNSKEIKSDFYLIFSLFKELFVFLLLLIPYFIMAFFYILTFNFEKARDYFGKIFGEPFKIFAKIVHWFFQAKYTAYLILFMFFIFFIEVTFLFANQSLMNFLMANPTHFLEGNYYSIVTSIFLHANIIHLLSNSLALLIFGRIVEKQFGWKMLFIFLSSGIIANLVSDVISYMQNNIYYSLGASGGIAGLIMLAILLEPFALSSVFIIPLPLFVIGWFLIAMDVIGLTNPSGTNHLAHLGGYSALLLLFFFLEFRHRRKIILGFSINLFMIALFYLALKIMKVKIFGL